MPVFLRAPLFGLFSFIYGVKIEEATRPFQEYSTFTDFFTRTLHPGVRQIHRPNRASAMCSPCDGAVLSIGMVNDVDSTIDCVKGRSYRLDEFMTGVKDESECVP
jgi:phosphatidylserine decarboxylase